MSVFQEQFSSQSLTGILITYKYQEKSQHVVPNLYILDHPTVQIYCRASITTAWHFYHVTRALATVFVVLFY